MAINNAAIFNAALAGSMAGMQTKDGAPSTTAGHYDPIANEANAFATELDSLIVAIPGGPSIAQAELIQSLSEDYFGFLEAQSGSTTPVDYAHAAGVVFSAYTSANALIIPAPPVGSGALTPVNTAAKGAVGSGRAIDIPVASVVNGTVVWINSKGRYYVWDAASTLADNAATEQTVLALLDNGANPGRFVSIDNTTDERRWEIQTQWFVDEGDVTGLANNDNDGNTALTPLLSDSERDRRMGISASWASGQYDIWTKGAARVRLRGGRSGASSIFVHGSWTAFQGTQLVAPASITAHVTIVEATNTRSNITGGTANANLCTTAQPNRRLRLVTGANAGAISFPQKTGGGSICDVSQWSSLPSYDPTTNPIPTAVSPADGDTYVVETLGTITAFESLLTKSDVTTVLVGITVDSANLVTSVIGADSDPVGFVGCTGVAPADANFNITWNGNAYGLASMTIGGAFYSPQISCFACHNLGPWAPYPGSIIQMSGRTMTQGCRAVITSLGGTALYGNSGTFDSSSNGTDGNGGSTLFEGPLWGSGNTNSGYGGISDRARIIQAGGGSVAQLTITGAADFVLGGKSTARAFLDATNVYSAARNCTWALLAASVATGFAGNAIDVDTGTSIVLI